MTDPYFVLGVSPTATPADITHAYRLSYATSTPTSAPGNRIRKPTSACGKFWKPMPCYVTRTVAPPTTALIPPTKTPVQTKYQ